jgi:EAL domain-containing protein (putative c-di-GMP-specific phosphodiesterase class I)
VLKVDKSFVDHVTSGQKEAALIRTILTLGQMLDLRTVAEGVEDESTVEALRAQRCDLAQGYHFSRPLPVEEFTLWVRDRASAPHRGFEPTRLVRAPLLVS